MENKEKYKMDINDIIKYRRYCEGAFGGEEAMKYFEEGYALAQKSDEVYGKYYTYCADGVNYCRRFEKLDREYFVKSAAAYKKSAVLGNEIAIFAYALYLYFYEDNEPESFIWFLAASSLGLAVADYWISTFYKKGECGLPTDEKMSDFYFERYQARCKESERQLYLAWDIDDDKRDAYLCQTYMFDWFNGMPTHVGGDLRYITRGPCEWRYYMKTRKHKKNAKKNR